MSASASAAALEEYNRRHREALGQRPPQRRKAQRRRRRQGQGHGQGQGIPEPLEPPPLQGMVVDSVASHEGEEDPGSVVLGVLV